MSDAPAHAWTEHDGRLLRLRLARPKANVMDAAMMGALEEGLDAHLDEPTLTGVVLDAQGPHFSFGASVEEHLPGRCAEMLSAFHRLLLKLVASPVPVLAAVQGQCLGGGLELAATAHLIFVAPDAVLGQPEIRLGVFAPAASCLLPERTSRAHAEDILISGRSIGARDALDMGLANAIAEDPVAEAMAYFDHHLAPRSASSVRHAVRAARADMVERVRAKLEGVERQYLDELMRSHDAEEGLQAFLEKREAHWEHR